MDEIQKVDVPEVKRDDDSSVGILDVLIFFARHKKPLLGLPMLAGLLAGGISFAFPDVYKANSKILPPQQSQSSASALLAQLGGAAGAAASTAGLKNPNDIYIGMLKSRTIANRLVERFNLQKVYDYTSLEKTEKKLEDNTSIVTGREGLIQIEVEDEDRHRATDITNAYTEELIRLTKTIAVTEAGQRRAFYERQLETAKNNLANAEAAFKRSLDTTGMISVDSDGRAVVETIAKLRAQISVKEVKMTAMRAFVTNGNQDYKREDEELKGLRLELNKLQNGSPDRGDNVGNVGGKQSGLENIKILREVKYHQMLYELLAKQYEIARLDEAKDSSSIQVLDPAALPEKKFRPKRGLIILATVVLTFLLTVFGAFAVEAKRTMSRTPEVAKKFELLWSSLRF